MTDFLTDKSSPALINNYSLKLFVKIDYKLFALMFLNLAFMLYYPADNGQSHNALNAKIV